MFHEKLQKEFGLTTSEISVKIGKSVAYVSNSLRLLTLPDALKDGLLSGLITEGHARALAAIDDPELMIEAYKIILRESGSVRRAPWKASSAPRSHRRTSSSALGRTTVSFCSRAVSMSTERSGEVSSRMRWITKRPRFEHG